jgi:hypothetical protein
MTEFTEFESTTHWQRKPLRMQENGRYSEEKMSDVKSFVAHEIWASVRTDGPGMLAIPDEIIETQQISSGQGLLAGLDKWGFVYGVLNTPTSKGRAISVKTPSDHWSWCGDPKSTPRISLKKRMSILSHFDG